MFWQFLASVRGCYKEAACSLWWVLCVECGCVFMCVQVQMFTHEGWKSKDNLGCWSSGGLFIFETQSVTSLELGRVG